MDSKISEIAESAKTKESFHKALIKYLDSKYSSIDVAETNRDYKEWERLWERYYNYMHTYSPIEYQSAFQAKYASNYTTLDDLLELKAIMGIRKLKKGTKAYTMISEKSSLYKALSRLNRDSTTRDVERTVKVIYIDSYLFN